MKLAVTVHLSEDYAIEKIELKEAPSLKLKLSRPNKAIEAKLLTWLKAYALGKNVPFPLPLNLSSLPPFTTAVLVELAKQPYGTTVSYAELAARAGNGKAFRAAGSACGRNPFPLAIPCHRVLASNGLGGFSLGLEIKKMLLEHEGAV